MEVDMADFVPRGARRPIALPRRSDVTDPSRRSAPEVGKKTRPTVNTHDVAAEARARVVQEIERRGGRAREVHEGRRTELRVDTPTGSVTVRVFSRRSGDW